ncbi:MAG: methylmalonyl-CoA mutase family protein [Candidatus Xenobium sp.]|nr:hypothetical protein [Burkholderiales bacterium]
MSTLEALELAVRFPVPNRSTWEEAAQAELKATPLARLTRLSLEGVEIRPLYLREDLQDRPLGIPWTQPAWKPVQPASGSALGEPGAPLVAVPLELGQDSAQVVAQGLARGETALDLYLGPEQATALKAVLEGVEVPVFLNGLEDPLTALEALPQVPRSGALFCDPLSFLARTGNLTDSLDSRLDRVAEAFLRIGAVPDLAILGIDAGLWHEGGADVAQQSGWALATGLDLVRSLVSRGLGLQQVLDRMAFAFTLSPRLFPEMARLRAFRRLWTRVADLLGGEGPVRLVARTGRFHRSAWDPYTNLIRSTVEAFAGICGGADALCIEPMDAAAGGGVLSSRRHAVSQALVLLEEASLHRVVDPGAGSSYLEVLTDEIAQKAWSYLQAIEKAGGMTAALREGIPQQEAAATAERRLQALSGGRGSLVGVSHYAVPAEPPASAPSAEPPEAPAGAGETVRRVQPQRLAAAFEALRLRTRALEERRGRPVRALMASLGGSATSRVRAQFCVTFLGAAGFRTESPVGLSSVAEALVEAQRAEVDILVLCAEDSEYAGLLEELRRLPGQRPLVAVAGMPAEADGLRSRGTDFFIHRDADRVETAGGILARLEAL